MPAALTYPGVYVEEIPSGVRSIVGVGTSITAFVGRSKWGPVNKAILVNGYADFERTFGGVWSESRLANSVRDFFLNGGSQAYIVRLFKAEAGGAPSKLIIKVGDMSFEAAEEGTWAKNLRISINWNVSTDTARELDIPLGKLFNVTVIDVSDGTIETFRNVSNLERARSSVRIDKVLERSLLIRWHGDLAEEDEEAADDAVPDAEGDDVSALDKVLAEAQKGRDFAAIREARDSLKAAIVDLEVSDGLALTSDEFVAAENEGAGKGLYALDGADLFNLLCIPPYAGVNGPDEVDPEVIARAGAYCEKRRAMLLVDPPTAWGSKEAAREAGADLQRAVGTNSKNAAIFFPRLKQVDPLAPEQIGTFAPSGAIAGIFARTDATRGVWKAPAGYEATLVGVPDLSVKLSDLDNGDLNQLGINCLRAMPAAGRMVWGARTMQGDDRLTSEWKYIPVRRTALFIEESLYRGTKWAVFEPNDEPLWAQIRLNIGAFMNDLYRQGAFQGQTPRDAYFVKCDKETTTQSDINKGIVNIRVGFAPLKPAEFVVIQLQQIAGQIPT